MKKLAVAVLLTLMLLPSAFAETRIKPEWATKDESVLNRRRTNETYEFKMFNTSGGDKDLLVKEALVPVLTYVREKYDAEAISMVYEEVAGESLDTPVTYKISFRDATGNGTVYARFIDDYAIFEDFETNVFQFEYYQLYAISEKNVTPRFDDYEIVRTTGSKAVVRSIIPGMGQIYKGQKRKGYGILASEAVLVADVIFFNYKADYSHDKVVNNIPNVDSWKSKEKSWKGVRNLAIGSAAGLYIYNLIDAAWNEGAKRLKVNAPEGTTVTMVPVATPDYAGASIVIRF